MKERKTISVSDFKSEINWALSAEVYTKQQREALQYTAEKILINNGSYKGFNYLRIDQVPKGCVAGVNVRTGEDLDATDVEEKFKETDSTRVYFH